LGVRVTLQVECWLVIGWEVKRAKHDTRCFDTEIGAHDFIGSFSDPERWVVLHGPERIERFVVHP
jgi:hypothetical protein